jgi:hypothetical protein
MRDTGVVVVNLDGQLQGTPEAPTKARSASGLRSLGNSQKVIEQLTLYGGALTPLLPVRPTFGDRTELTSQGAPRRVRCGEARAKTYSKTRDPR